MTSLKTSNNKRISKATVLCIWERWFISLNSENHNFFGISFGFLLLFYFIGINQAKGMNNSLTGFFIAKKFQMAIKMLYGAPSLILLFDQIVRH